MLKKVLMIQRERRTKARNMSWATSPSPPNLGSPFWSIPLPPLRRYQLLLPLLPITLNPPGPTSRLPQRGQWWRSPPQWAPDAAPGSACPLACAVPVIRWNVSAVTFAFFAAVDASSSATAVAATGSAVSGVQRQWPLRGDSHHLHCLSIFQQCRQLKKAASVALLANDRCFVSPSITS